MRYHESGRRVVSRRVVSVVVPVYFNEQSVPALFDELAGVEQQLDQRDVGLELIFIDDGSTDGSLRTLLEHKKRRRRIEFLDFMNRIVAAYPDTAIHVVLDNLKTHKPKNDRWLKRHPNVHFHFTPTRASWLNQVEIWFSILQGKSLHGASFTSVKQLRDHIDAFIEAYNENATPFAWTKSDVHQKRLKPRFANQ